MLGKEGDGTSEILENMQNKITEFETNQGQLQLEIKSLSKSALDKRKAGNNEGALQDMNRKKLRENTLAQMEKQINNLESQKEGLKVSQMNKQYITILAEGGAKVEQYNEDMNSDKMD